MFRIVHSGVAGGFSRCDVVVSTNSVRARAAGDALDAADVDARRTLIRADVDARAMMRGSGARPYVAGGIILWAVALQAHVWSIPEDELKRLRGDSAVSASVLVAPFAYKEDGGARERQRSSGGSSDASRG